MGELVEGQAPGAGESTQVLQLCRPVLAREHMQAQQAYLQLVGLNAAWALGGGSFVSSDGPQSGNRMWGVKTRKVAQTASLLDEDSQKKALQSFKRVTTFVEMHWNV